MTFDPHDKLSGGGAWYILAREVDTILRKGGHNFTMKQRCSSRERARCEMYLRNSQRVAKATRQRKKALHKKSDDARAGGAECTGSMMPPSYHRERGPPLQRWIWKGDQLAVVV